MRRKRCVKHGGEHLRIFLSDQYSWINKFYWWQRVSEFLKIHFVIATLFKTPCQTLLRGSNRFTPIFTSSYLLVGSEVNCIWYLVDLGSEFPYMASLPFKDEVTGWREKDRLLGGAVVFIQFQHACLCVLNNIHTYRWNILTGQTLLTVSILLASVIYRLYEFVIETKAHAPTRNHAHTLLSLYTPLLCSSIVIKTCQEIIASATKGQILFSQLNTSEHMVLTIPN